jgi:peptide/nickel transport system substrate-binding protein
LGLGLVVSGCQQDAGQQKNGAPQTAIIGLTGDFDTFLELATANADALHVIEEMLFLTFCELDENLGLQPRLAKSWEVSADGKIITFTLRDDVVWSDGQPTTAEDALFTYQLASHPETGYAGRDRFAQVDTVIAVDSTTIRFLLKEAYPEALLDLQIPILPKHVLANIPPEQIRQAAFNRAPVGNGPFILKEWRPNDYAVFEANARYFAGRPKLDRVIFRMVPDETTLLANLLTGEIDVVPYVSPDKVDDVRQKPGLRVITYPDRGYSFLAFNLGRPIFQDRRVRQAIAQAIHRQNLIEVLLHGQGRLVSGPIMPYFEAYDSTLTADFFRPAAAESLLHAAGWMSQSGERVRAKGGQALAFTMKTNADNKLRRDALVMIQADLKKIGVQAQPELVEFGKLVEEVLRRRDFDAVLLSWKTGYTVNPSPLWHSNAIAGGYNFVSYRNPDVDSLLAVARREREAARAKTLWHEFQRLVAEDCPYVFLFSQENAGVARQRIKNITMDVRGYLINVEEWTVDDFKTKDAE